MVSLGLVSKAWAVPAVSVKAEKSPNGSEASGVSVRLPKSGFIVAPARKGRALLNGFGNSWRKGGATHKHVVAQAATSFSDVAIREELKRALVHELETTDGYINDKCLALVDDLKKLNPTADVRSRPDLFANYFEGIKLSFKGTGRKGEAAKKMALLGAGVTIGKLTFQQIKPTDLEVICGQPCNLVGINDPNNFTVIVEFTINEPDLPRLEGFFINYGAFRWVSPIKHDVLFESVSILPRYPEKDLEAWNKIFAEANPSIDQVGRVKAQLPAMNAWIEYLYIDEDIRIVKGNEKNVNVVRKIDANLYPINS